MKTLISSRIAVLVVISLRFAVARAEDPISAASSQEDSVHVTVSKDFVNLRTAPDIHSKPAKVRLNKGDVLIVRRSSKSDWYEIQLPFPFKGLFVRQDLVTLDQIKR